MGPKKKKSAGKKKLSKAERLRLQKEEEDRRLIEEEEARLRAELEEAARIEKERIEREKTEQLEAKDQERRGLELAELQVLEENFLTAARWKEKFRASAKWEHYVGCDGSPDPTVPQEINTFMSLWQEDTNNDIKVVVEMGNNVLKLIEKLEFFILDTPFHELTPSDVARYQDTIQKLQTLLHQKYNKATEQLLKQASNYAESESGNMDVVIKETGIRLCIWANLKKNPRFRSQIFYDEEKERCNGFELPKPLAVCDVAVRILHTYYDHLSPLLIVPKEPPKLDLPEVKPAAAVTSMDKKEEEGPKSAEESYSESDAEQVTDGAQSYMSTISSQASYLPEHESPRGSYDKRSSMIRSISRAQISALQIVEEEPELEDYVVDLHQFMPVGGVYHFDVLKLPPQAKQAKGWTMVEVLDTGLEILSYTAVCEENEDPSLVTVGITVQLLDSVIYFEEPLIARWDAQDQCWRTDEIGEVVYNMKEKEVSFKMNSFCTVTLLQDAHLNMPYQSWELRPNGTNQALLTVITNFAEVQIQIKLNQCMLVSIATVEETELLLELRGIWMAPLALTRALKHAGMNIFPTEHSAKYVRINKKVKFLPFRSSQAVLGIHWMTVEQDTRDLFARVFRASAKSVPSGFDLTPPEAKNTFFWCFPTLLAEITAYQQMALVASAFAFSWSKWNAHSGEDQVVFKACEHLGGEDSEATKDNRWALYMFNGQRAQRLQITEASYSFSKNIAEDTEFHSTLYHLIRDAASKTAMEQVQNIHYLFIDAIYQLLIATRVLTYA